MEKQMKQPVDGWLIMEDEPPYRAFDFIIDDEEMAEAPISNDNGILQFHIRIDFSTDYPTLSIIE